MKNRFSIILILIICLFNYSCITNKQKKYLQIEEVPSYKMAQFQPYKLSINDEITYYLMSANQETQLFYNSGQQSATTVGNYYRIYEDGCAVLPTIGRVKIVDMTLPEAERAITDAFRTIVFDAEVKIALVNNYFYIQGDLGKGQFFMYKENLNIFQALAMAGDLTNMADKGNVCIIRKGADGMDKMYKFDLRKESVLESEFYYIKPNDVIYVPTSSKSFFRVDSVSSFVSMFVAPLSLLSTILLYIKK